MKFVDDDAVELFKDRPHVDLNHYLIIGAQHFLIDSSVSLDNKHVSWAHRLSVTGE